MLTKKINGYFLLVFLYFLGVSFFLSPILGKIFPSGAVATIIMQFLIFLPLLFFYFYRYPVSPKETLSLRPIRVADLLLCLGVSLCAMPFVSMIVLITSVLQTNLAEASLESMMGSNFFLVLFLTAIQPAVFEELLFRGVGYRAYGCLGEKKAILASAFLFALLHMNLQQAAYAFVLGVLFAFLVGRTGSILASVIPHFFINASNWAAMFLSPAESAAPAVEYTFGQQVLGVGIQCLVALPFLVGLLWLFMRRNPKSRYEMTALEGERFFTPAIWVIIAIFAGMCVFTMGIR
ncbi:CPBP family intramembrane metalloprotease [Anaerotignum lactatifermentans]|uniref:CPBP family intramembrane metalloprotease n=1 Tax=Anaerotignum lactatifermentans TaxID=160404 RepID=A0ABS2GAQ4_9FIRM|nr:type II CAAX endopeptidase family protein [Anaerotignum lactatifermentans]MBM6828584.1 CPBP family intramembrane metalloprotease [Anaerotignum lactatifermentans]MBM6878544.1 CPBP family intramembrane metalloprotease [Anaerotignum lactatifermentans]MBM6950166.1 CPBP family intramembrane metalloprotease [Anaerotignum lactatifermentans]